MLLQRSQVVGAVVLVTCAALSAAAPTEHDGKRLLEFGDGSRRWCAVDEVITLGTRPGLKGGGFIGELPKNRHVMREFEP